MHYHLKLQQEDLKAQELTKGDGFVYKISNQDQTIKDVEKYAINQVAQLYKKGDIYITMPYLPYRVKGPLTRTQRTILLQLVSIQDDYNNLKVTKGGTQADLADTH